MLELWQYLSKQSNTKTPLELSGFDCQLTGFEVDDRLQVDLVHLFLQLEIDRDSKLGKYVLGIFNYETIMRNKGGDIDEFVSITDKLCKRIESKLPDSGGADICRLKLWQQLLKSFQSLVRDRWIEEFDLLGGNNSRDMQMAKNFDWLLANPFANRKVMVWAHSSHIIDNYSDLRSLRGIGKDQRWDEVEKLVPFGQHVKKSLGEKAFSIAFTAAEGTFGLWSQPSGGRIEPPRTDSLEYLFVKAGIENGLLQLTSNSPKAKWLNEELVARPLSYKWMKTCWGNHFDAMIFNKTMEKSFPYDEK